MRPKDSHGLNLTDVVWGHSVSLIRPTVDVARHNSDILSEPSSRNRSTRGRVDSDRDDPHTGLTLSLT